MNNKKGLSVKKAGLFTQVQDKGRFNQAQQGLSQGGVCDELAAGWANFLLGNSADAALLEISFGQAEFEALSDINLSLTGAPMGAKIMLPCGDIIEQENNSSFLLKCGQRLVLSFATSGVRAYIAVQGGFSIAMILSSASTVKRNFIGGLKGDGNMLQSGEFLPIGKQSVDLPIRKIPIQFIPDYSQSVILQ